MFQVAEVLLVYLSSSDLDLIPSFVGCPQGTQQPVSVASCRSVGEVSSGKALE